MLLDLIFHFLPKLLKYLAELVLFEFFDFDLDFVKFLFLIAFPLYLFFAHFLVSWKKAGTIN